MRRFDRRLLLLSAVSFSCFADDFYCAGANAVRPSARPVNPRRLDVTAVGSTIDSANADSILSSSSALASVGVDGGIGDNADAGGASSVVFEVVDVGELFASALFAPSFVGLENILDFLMRDCNVSAHNLIPVIGFQREGLTPRNILGSQRLRNRAG